MLKQKRQSEMTWSCSMGYWEDQVCQIPWDLLNPWDWNFLGEIPEDFPRGILDPVAQGRVPG